MPCWGARCWGYSVSPAGILARAWSLRSNSPHHSLHNWVPSWGCPIACGTEQPRALWPPVQGPCRAPACLLPQDTVPASSCRRPGLSNGGAASCSGGEAWDRTQSCTCLRLGGLACEVMMGTYVLCWASVLTYHTHPMVEGRNVRRERGRDRRGRRQRGQEAGNWKLPCWGRRRSLCTF